MLVARRASAAISAGSRLLIGHFLAWAWGAFATVQLFLGVRCIAAIEGRTFIVPEIKLLGEVAGFELLFEEVPAFFVADSFAILLQISIKVPVVHSAM